MDIEKLLGLTSAASSLGLIKNKDYSTLISAISKIASNPENQKIIRDEITPAIENIRATKKIGGNEGGIKGLIAQFLGGGTTTNVQPQNNTALSSDNIVHIDSKQVTPKLNDGDNGDFNFKAL